MQRYYYSSPIPHFLTSPTTDIIGHLTASSTFPVSPNQRDAWLEQIAILRTTLNGRTGTLYLEYSIPRMGKRIDAVVLLGPVVFVLESK